jgi:type IV secretory pathway VirB9-like protein
MYLVFPVMVAYQEVPLLRGIGPNGPHLLNSRQVGRVIVVDQLASRLELRLGIGAQAEVVQVVRGVLETIQCPGHAQCPTW